METTILKWATIIGGLAAIGYFWDKFAPDICEKFPCLKLGIIVLMILIIVLVIIYHLRRKFFRERDEIEQPEGPVSLYSPFYIERSPVESEGYETIVEPGALIRIKAPRQMGKTSLMTRILYHAQQQGYRTVSLSLHGTHQASPRQCCDVSV